MICIYHNADLDGFACAAIVKSFNPEAILIGYDYGQPIPNIPTGHDLFVCDVSFPTPADLFIMAGQCNRTIWIDHHISAINMWNEYAKEKQDAITANKIQTFLDPAFSACELTWKWFKEEKDMPRIIYRLGKYDSWRNNNQAEWDTIILPFQYGMRAVCNSPETFPMHLLAPKSPMVDIEIDDITSNGKSILRYLEKVNQKICKDYAFAHIFPSGISAVCLHYPGGNSDTFKSVWNPERFDLMILFAPLMNYTKVSLYTTNDNIDCSLLAKAMGGGGHKKAAGFIIKNVPDFLLNTKFKYAVQS